MAWRRLTPRKRKELKPESSYEWQFAHYREKFHRICKSYGICTPHIFMVTPGDTWCGPTRYHTQVQVRGTVIKTNEGPSKLFHLWLDSL